MASIGLDIGSHSIKAVALNREGKVWRLIAAGVAATPSPGISAESEKALVAVSEAIKKLFSDAKINDKKVSLALPEPIVYTRLIPFPPLSDTEVSSAMEWQIESYIPIPKRDAFYDHQIVSRSEKEVEVLLVAAPKGTVEKYMRVVEQANLEPVSIETELIALSRSIAPPNKRAIVVDLGASSTDAAVVINGQLVFSRSFPTAGEALTRAVAQAIGVQTHQAEEYKRTYGLESSQLEGKVKQAIDPVLSVVVDELKKAAGFWENDHPNQPIEAVILSGGTAGLPELIPILTNFLGTEVIIGDPFARVVRDEKVAKALASYAPLYAIAVGLAMKD